MLDIETHSYAYFFAPGWAKQLFVSLLEGPYIVTEKKGMAKKKTIDALENINMGHLSLYDVGIALM